MPLIRPRKSGVWLYFVETSDPEAPLCTLCGKTAPRKGGNTNQMMSHLKHNHPPEFEHVNKMRVEAISRSRQCVNVMAEHPTVTASLFFSPSFLALFPAADRRNFPSRTTLMSRVIPQMANEIRYNNNKVLNGKPVCLVVDSWTAKNSVVCREGTHLGEALFAFHEAKNHLQSVIDEDESETKALARTIRDELKKKELLYLKDKNVLLFSFFDPAKVGALLNIKWEKVSKLVPRTACSTTLASSPVSQTAPAQVNLYKTNSHLTPSSVYSSFNRTTTAAPKPAPSSLDSEVVVYLSLCKSENVDTSAVEFWKAHVHKLPILANLSKRYLSVPCTSVSAERVFSIAGVYL